MSGAKERCGEHRGRHSGKHHRQTAAEALAAGGGIGGGGGAAGRRRRRVLGVHGGRRRRRQFPRLVGPGLPAPLALDGYGQGSNGPSQGIAVGEPDPNGVRYRADGKLPDGPRTAPVYLPGREVAQSEVAALAKTLQVQGIPRLVQGTWTVGGGTGASEPVLQVSQKAPGNWSYARYGTPGGTHCEHPRARARKTAMGDDLGGKSADDGGGCPQFRDGAQGTDPVPEDKAKSVAAPVLKALGQDNAKIDAGRRYGAVRTVTADPVLNSLPTYGWQTSLQVGADAQLVAGSGQLQLPKKGADYPLVTARQALDQLNKGGGTSHPAIGGCASAVPYRDGGKAPCEGKPTAVPDPAAVRSATFGLSAQSVGGHPALVPSWLFAVQMPGTPDKSDKSATVTVAQPAVDPAYIAKPGRAPSGSPTGTPSAPPRRRPGRCGWTPTRWRATARSSSCTSGAGCAAPTPHPPRSPRRP
ncbi:hypothetical protein GCM10020000_58900 [Streptomyces olivoverticillatus]